MTIKKSVLKASEHDLRVYESIEGLISSIDNPTPLVRINKRLNTNPKFSIYLKLERFNPFGSIKDRIALSMLDGIHLNGKKCIIEPSSGNTGIALTCIANARKIPIEIAVPKRIPHEKKILLRMLGVKVLWEADDNLCPVYPNEGARGLVNGIVNSSCGNEYYFPNQYENELNVLAHYKTTGPEIWKQTRGKVQYFFAGLGTCGTITGVGKFLKEKNSSIKIIGIEPSVTEHNIPGMKRITGLRKDLVPKILKQEIIDEIIEIEDNKAYNTSIQLARKTGILAGPTTGAIVAAALDYGKDKEGLVVCISPDDATKYISSYAKYVKNDGNLIF
ncbi:MAG: PLP-dependent cysteine synthase family protein [Candidatus Odinarchaeota archaeon]